MTNALEFIAVAKPTKNNPIVKSEKPKTAITAAKNAQRLKNSIIICLIMSSTNDLLKLT